MKATEIREWLKTEFQPLTLATPDPTIDQLIANTLRFFNTHSAYKWMGMYDAYTSSDLGGMVTLSREFKSVVQVYPATETAWIWRDHPLWTLLGVTMLDNVTSDLILMSAAFQNYRIYTGTDFTWTYIKSENPDENGGRLMLRNLPNRVTKVCVVGARRVFMDEDITMEHILEWVLNYSKALLKKAEGNILRKSNIIGVKNDGQEMYNEGEDERKELEARLAEESRWICFVKRV